MFIRMIFVYSSNMIDGINSQRKLQKVRNVSFEFTNCQLVNHLQLKFYTIETFQKNSTHSYTIQHTK